MNSVEKKAKKTNKGKTTIDEVTKSKVVNWMREIIGGELTHRTAKEAKEHFPEINRVSIRTINNWVMKRSMTAKELLKEAKELRKKEIVEHFVVNAKLRGELRKRLTNLLIKAANKEVPNSKELEGLMLLKKSVDTVAGMDDFEKLEKEINDLEHKKEQLKNSKKESTGEGKTKNIADIRKKFGL